MATDKLQELIETLKTQGVRKGEDAAAQIVETARKEAASILEAARAEAKSIVDAANAESDAILKRLQSSMEIAASQFVGNLKRVIEHNLMTLPLEEEIATALGDTDFLKNLITGFVTAYGANPQNPDIALLLPEGSLEPLKQYAVDLMARRAGAAGKDGLVLETHGVRFGFQVDKKGGNARLDFSDEAFLSLFTQFLSPKFRELFTGLKVTGAAE